MNNHDCAYSQLLGRWDSQTYVDSADIDRSGRKPALMEMKIPLVPTSVYLETWLTDVIEYCCIEHVTSATCHTVVFTCMFR